jgi:hypothetical protein
MPRTRRILGPDGQEHEAEPIGFRASGEHFNEYLLDDRVILRIKHVLTDVWIGEGGIRLVWQPDLLRGAVADPGGRRTRRAQGRDDEW